jgi:uridine kinase
LQAPVVHTDDFASWERPQEWWLPFLDTILRPIASGQSVRYKPSSWGGPDRDEVTVEPTDFIVVEGVGASRAAFGPHLAYSIWIETPREVRLSRGLERDGDSARANWEAWMADEDDYIRRERPADRADLVIPGDRDIQGRQLTVWD